jgi:ATP-dependent DNA helicase RecQ
VLAERFGFASFREGQEEVVAAVLAGKDVLCVMPTGAGKSLCYQLPAVLRPGVTLVVSPLIALMKDQVESLTRRGLPAAQIHSQIPPEEQEAALDAAERGQVRLLYVAPERFRSDRFARRILSVGVSLVAVDEAHCISAWGHDFRPDYRRLGPAIQALGRPQVIALTATATREVQDDVVQQLSLREPHRFLDGLVRANLAFTVHACSSQGEKDARLAALLSGDGAAIVYCATRKQVERVAGVLEDRGIPALAYHAGLEDGERSASQEAFLSGRARVIVATNAFGMGVDRPDVRRVVHFEVPRSVEAYVQESGRAGRDGAPAGCTVLFHAGDLHVQRFFIEATNPSREVIAEVLRVLTEAGDERLELTAEAIAERMRLHAPPAAVNASLAVLDRASVVRRGRRDENLARVTVLPSEGDLFQVTPLPPGLGRLLASLVERFGVGEPSDLDVEGLAAARDVTADTVRRGLHRLHELARIDYVPAFRGRATEVVRGGDPREILAAVDFAALAERRRREEKKLDDMVAYVHARGCRRKHLLRCFGAPESPPCGRCDRCGAGGTAAHVPAPSPRSEEALRHVLEAVRAHDGRFGFGKIAQHLAGSTAQGVGRGPLSRGRTYGILARLGVAGAETVVRMAQEEGLLALVPKTLQAPGARGPRRVHLLGLTPEGREVLDGRRPVPTIVRPP